MSKKNVLILFMMFFSFSIFGQKYVHTSKENVIRKKITNFTVVNNNGYVLSKTPVKYDTKKNMPLCYFTIDPVLVNRGKRRFMIHNTTTNISDGGDWVMSYNNDEDDVFFSKAKFIVNPNNMKWFMVLQDEKILIYNTSKNKKIFYLGIDINGNFTFTENITDDAKWELIINKNY